MNTKKDGSQPLESVRSRRKAPILGSALAVLLAAGQPQTALAQGCVSTRGDGMTSCAEGAHAGGDTAEAGAAPTGFRVSVGYRWLHSDRMFIHEQEQTQREAEGSQEINDSHFINVRVAYDITPRFSASLTLPFAVNDRSQVVRALNVQRTILDRFHTHSQGLGDVRLTGAMALWDPKSYRKGNVILGAGVAAPTGDRDVQGNFKIARPRLVVVTQQHAVDPSIQLGAGGWGLGAEIYAYREMLPRLTGFVNGSYTFTPGEKYTPTASLLGDYSIADYYFGRMGFEYVAWRKYALSFSLAGRIDGVPREDLIGGSDGFRRPGYAVSIEPGITAGIHAWSFSLYAPVAVSRNRQQSLPEQAAGVEPFAAGFADFLLMFQVERRF